MSAITTDSMPKSSSLAEGIGQLPAELAQHIFKSFLDALDPLDKVDHQRLRVLVDCIRGRPLGVADTEPQHSWEDDFNQRHMQAGSSVSDVKLVHPQRWHQIMEAPTLNQKGPTLFEIVDFESPEETSEAEEAEEADVGEDIEKTTEAKEEGEKTSRNCPDPCEGHTCRLAPNKMMWTNCSCARRSYHDNIVPAFHPAGKMYHTLSHQKWLIDNYLQICEHLIPSSIEKRVCYPTESESLLRRPQLAAEAEGHSEFEASHLAEVKAHLGRAKSELNYVLHYMGITAPPEERDDIKYVFLPATMDRVARTLDGFCYFIRLYMQHLCKPGSPLWDNIAMVPLSDEAIDAQVRYFPDIGDEFPDTGLGV